MKTGFEQHIALAAFRVGFVLLQALGMSSRAADKVSADLRLEVFPVAAVTPMEVHSIVTNIGDRPITIPTSTYSGGVTGWTQGNRELGIDFFICYRSAGERRLVPAASKFHPVTLQPGESTELPLVRAPLAGEKSVEVMFSVEDELARRHGWWSGKLRTKVEIGVGENPYYETQVEAEVPAPNTSPPPAKAAESKARPKP